MIIYQNDRFKNDHFKKRTCEITIVFKNDRFVFDFLSPFYNETIVFQKKENVNIPT